MIFIVIFHFDLVKGGDRLDDGKPQAGRFFVLALPLVTVEQGRGAEAGSVAAVGDCQRTGGRYDPYAAVLLVVDVSVFDQVGDEGGGNCSSP